MDADQMHELRMAIGVGAMDTSDAVDEDTFDVLMEATVAMDRAMTCLVDRGLPRSHALGMVQQIAATAAFKREADS